MLRSLVSLQTREERWRLAGPVGAGGCGREEGPGLAGGQAPRSARTLWGPLVPECALMPRCPLTRRVSSVVQRRSSVRRTRAGGGYLPAQFGQARGRPGEGQGCDKRYQSSAPDYLPSARLGEMPPSLSRWLPPPASPLGPLLPAGAQDALPAPRRERGSESGPLFPTTVAMAIACWRSAGPPSRQPRSTL